MAHPFLPIDAAAFVRHGVIVGQSGSGKTGLLIAILEALALSGVPILAIDLKNDLSNTALAGLDPATLATLLNPHDAAAQGTTPEALAVALVARWRAALQAEGLDDQTFRDRVYVRILTPGSDLAPVDVLGTLTTLPDWIASAQRRDWITGAVSALLSLVDLPSDPLTDPGAILLAQLYTDAFDAGESLPFDLLLPRIVNPPFDRLGIFPVDEAIPPKARQQLALRLNHVLASPSFAPWRHGVPLDLNAWFAPVDGKTPITVLCLNHLPDDQRAFFVSLVLHAQVAWMRRQPGTQRPRAVLAFDEAFGFLPPNPHNPPSKPPILTLVKQGRAHGCGVILATQNPKDLDHRAIANAGTWLVARLLTEHDRDRVIEGMGGDDRTLHDQLAALPDRTFLWRDPAGRQKLVRSPHTRSILLGPLTDHHLAALLQPTAPNRRSLPLDRTSGPPPLPHGVEVVWLPEPPAALRAHLSPLTADHPAWVPALYADANARIRDDDEEVARTRRYLWLRPDADPISINLPETALTPSPQPGDHALLPDGFATSSALAAWRDNLLDHLAHTVTARRFIGPGVRGALGEPEADVAARFPGVVLTPVHHRPIPRDVRIERFCLVWLPNPNLGGD